MRAGRRVVSGEAVSCWITEPAPPKSEEKRDALVCKPYSDGLLGATREGRYTMAEHSPAVESGRVIRKTSIEALGNTHLNAATTQSVARRV